MNYEQKYLKYKQKYLCLKNNIYKTNQIGGKNEIIGINYEAGKIITHILKYDNCIGYANIQIAMDAPYHGRVASEEVRSAGRSETFFPCYNEKYLTLQLRSIFQYIKDIYGDTKIVIQIARGRAAKPMYDEVLNPIIINSGLTNIIFVNGYRSKDYYQPKDKEKFVFVNIGMFAVLQNVEKVEVAEICNPNETIIINNMTDFERDHEITNFDDDKNILNNFSFQKITLAGISDDMPFVTPDKYPKELINTFLSKINLYF